VFGALALTPDARAQLYSGSLTGLVTDPSGGVVPGATVKLIDADKGFSYEAETDSAGRYVLRSLPPGNYRLSVSVAGFRTHAQEGITINVSQNATVDAVLQVGAQAETVEVSAAAPALSTQDAVTGQEVNRTFINDLPRPIRFIRSSRAVSCQVRRFDASSSCFPFLNSRPAWTRMNGP